MAAKKSKSSVNLMMQGLSFNKEEPSKEPVKEEPVPVKPAGLNPMATQKAEEKAPEAPMNEPATAPAAAPEHTDTQEIRITMEKPEIKVRTGVGRPKQEGEFQNVTIRLTKANYLKARHNSGDYGGMTQYINRLIEAAN